MTLGAMAILVTGEVRASQGLLTDLARIDPPHKVICSVWDRVGTKVGGWIGPWQLGRLLGPQIGDAMPACLIGAGHLEAFLPDFFDALRAATQDRMVDVASLQKLTPHVDVENYKSYRQTIPTGATSCNAWVIHYKIARAMAQMRVLEEEQGYRFDTVLRVRPDLEALPAMPDMAPADTIFLDWFVESERPGWPSAGDNAIFGRRELMVALCEHMRAAIHDRQRGNIHDIIASYVLDKGLHVDLLAPVIGRDLWPVDLFLDCLKVRCRRTVEDATAREFLDCIEANAALARSDAAGAKAVLGSPSDDEPLPFVLCRGRIALAMQDIPTAEKQLSILEARRRLLPNMDHFFYYNRLAMFLADNKLRMGAGVEQGDHSIDGDVAAPATVY